MNDTESENVEASLTTAEFCDAIRDKDRSLRRFLNTNVFPADIDAHGWLAYLTGIKSALGNLSNDLGFVATLLVKRYLQHRFGIANFDAASKLQGAPGVDIARSRLP